MKVTLHADDWAGLPALMRAVLEVAGDPRRVAAQTVGRPGVVVDGELAYRFLAAAHGPATADTPSIATAEMDTAPAVVAEPRPVAAALSPHVAALAAQAEAAGGLRRPRKQASTRKTTASNKG